MFFSCDTFYLSLKYLDFAHGHVATSIIFQLFTYVKFKECDTSSVFGLHSSFLCNEIKNIRQMVFFCLFHNMITTGLRPELKIRELC